MEGCASTLLEIVPVTETFEGEMVWRGEVSVFKLTGHPAGAKKCYAWSHAVEGSDHRRFVVVLHWPPIESPQTAVRAAIAAEYRGKA